MEPEALSGAFIAGLVAAAAVGALVSWIVFRVERRKALAEHLRADPTQPAWFRGVHRVAYWLDTGVPVGGVRIPLDPVIGLIPIFGDVVAGAVGTSILVRAAQVGAPRALLARMAANVAADLLLGLIPIAGDVGDFFFRSNRRNLALLAGHLDLREPEEPARASRSGSA